MAKAVHYPGLAPVGPPDADPPVPLGGRGACRVSGSRTRKRIRCYHGLSMSIQISALIILTKIRISKSEIYNLPAARLSRVCRGAACC
jgi:hypothetical protein